MFVGDRAALNVSANKAGYEGVLPETFILTGHSAGGRFATAAGATFVENPDAVVADLLGVVMFDGVSRPPTFTDQLQTLIDAGIPDYQIAAPPQSWNAWGVATEAMLEKYPNQFFGVQIDAGSHSDVIGGNSLFARLGAVLSDLIVRPSPPGGKAAVRTFATGWVNDLYADRGPTDPLYGIYGRDPSDPYVANQPIVMGEAGATTLPAPPPVDINQYAGTWYEQGSVKMFFSLGLVNTTATYTPQSDGSVKVENAGNYFGPNGPSSTITGAALVVNSPTNTRLNVGFFFGQPNNTDEPGNYWILDYAPDYSWAIVGDPNGTAGYILTRGQEITDTEYDALVARAYQLGVKRNITRTLQFPDPAPAGVLPGPATLPATMRI
jgi:lipocalin